MTVVNTAVMMARFTHVVCAELNLGQLKSLLRDRFLVDIQGLNKVYGQPFKVSEIVARVTNFLDA